MTVTPAPRHGVSMTPSQPRPAAVAAAVSSALASNPVPLPPTSTPVPLPSLDGPTLSARPQQPLLHPAPPSVPPPVPPPATSATPLASRPQQPLLNASSPSAPTPTPPPVPPRAPPTASSPSTVQDQMPTKWTAAASAAKLFMWYIPKAVVVTSAAIVLFPLTLFYFVGAGFEGCGLEFVAQKAGESVQVDKMKNHTGIIVGYFLCLAQAIMPEEDDDREQREPVSLDSVPLPPSPSPSPPPPPQT